MSSALFDAVSRVARHEAQAVATASVGVVTDVHTSGSGGADHAVTVRLRDRGTVLPRVPVAVGALGAVATPAVDDLVLVVFADGDHAHPVVAGRLYRDDLAPPKHGDGQIVLALPAGSDDPALGVVADAGAPKLTLTVGETTVEVADKVVTVTCGSAVVKVDGSGAAVVSLEAGDAKVELQETGAVTIEAATTLTLKAMQIELKGDAMVKVSAPQVSLG